MYNTHSSGCVFLFCVLLVCSFLASHLDKFGIYFSVIADAGKYIAKSNYFGKESIVNVFESILA